MKKLLFFAILIANTLFGQTSLTSFSLLSKNKIGEGVGIFYDLPSVNAIGLQFKNNEVWKVYSGENNTTTLKTVSFQYCFTESIPEKVKWFVNPAAGVLGGIGISTKNDQESKMLLKYPYFFGVFLEIGEGIKLSDHYALIGFIKFEGLAGILTDKVVLYENASSKGSLEGGFKFIHIK